MSSMLAAVYRYDSGLHLERVPVPEIGPSELLVRLDSASICATDIRIIQGAHRMFGPGVARIPGHEIAGFIEEAGAFVRGFVPGQRVFIAPNMGCGKCIPCRRGKNNLCPNYDAFGITLDGGFAEYIRITAPAIEQGNVMVLPDTAALAEAALCEPFACVLHGQDAIGVAPGDVVVIIGAGPIGVMHAKLAASTGAKIVVLADRAPERLELARRITTAHLVDASAEDVRAVVRRLTSSAGADAVIVAAPAPEAQQEALLLAAPGGRINFFAGLPKERPHVSIDANLVHYNELVITGTTACSTSDCRRALGMMLSGAVDLSQLISKRLPLEQAEEAFRAALNRSNLKIVLEMNGHGRPAGGTQNAAQTV